MVSNSELELHYLGFEFHLAHDCTLLHCIWPFILFLSSSQCDLNNIESNINHKIIVRNTMYLYPQHTKYVGVYSFCFSVRPFVRLYVHLFVHSFVCLFLRLSVTESKFLR